VVIDPHEERLSNLIQEFDILENPVTEFLAASPDDSAALGRFKNALEGIGFDLALAGTFAAGVKAVKLYRGGQADEAIKVLKKAEKGATPAEPKVAGKAGEVLQIDEVAEAEAKASSTTNTVAKEIPPRRQLLGGTRQSRSARSTRRPSSRTSRPRRRSSGSSAAGRRPSRLVCGYPAQMFRGRRSEAPRTSRPWCHTPPRCSASRWTPPRVVPC
jgi:hypothetical protein